MGCGNTKKDVENQIMIKKLERIDIQMERVKNLKLLEEIDGFQHKTIPIPDYIDPEFTQIKEGADTPLIKGGTENIVKSKKHPKKRIRKIKKRKGTKKSKSIDKETMKNENEKVNDNNNNINNINE